MHFGAEEAEEVSEHEAIVREDTQKETLHDTYQRLIHNAENAKEWEPESVSGKRFTPEGEIEYLVTFKASTSRTDKWQNLADLTCKDLVEKYEKAVGDNPSGKKPLLRVGDAVCVPWKQGALDVYCWVIRGRDGKLKCRYVHKYDPTCLF